MKNEKLKELLIEVSKKISDQEKINTEVSKVNAGWHIEHILLVIEKITEALKTSTPEEYKQRYNFIRTVVFVTKTIPRGKGKAPKQVLPKLYNKETLTAHLKKVIELLRELETIPKDNYFDHPFFGHLKTKKTITFLEIHTKHHLKIINAIIK